jgi:hypothetical protein
MRHRTPRPRPRAAMLVAALTGLLAVATWSDEAAAADDERGRPWARGTWMVGGGPGFGWGSDVFHLHLEVGGRYFVANGFSLGLSLADTIIIYSSSLKDEFPGIQKRIPTNVFRLVPNLQYVFFRNRYFSPYVQAGVGPAFMNHGSGTHGYWRASPGAYIGLGSSGVFLDIGVQFDGMFPVDRCNDAITDEMTGISPGGLCSFGWGPRIGIVGTFGGKPKPRAPGSGKPPPTNPLPAQTEPAPVAPPPVEPVPSEPVETTPVEPVEPPPVESTVPSEPPPPGESPPPSEPPPPSGTTPPPAAEPSAPGPTSPPVRPPLGR